MLRQWGDVGDVGAGPKIGTNGGDTNRQENEGKEQGVSHGNEGNGTPSLISTAVSRIVGQ